MSDATWYFADGDEERGPVTEAQIRTLIGTGNLKSDDLVWREGMDDWAPAREVPGLFGGSSSASAVDAQLPTSKARQERRTAAADAKEARPVTQRRELRAPSRWTPTRPIEVFKYLAFLGQPLLLAGVFLVLGSRGCESVATRYAERLASRVDVEEARFEAQWQRKLGLLEQQRDALDARQELNAAEQQHFKGLNEEIQELENQKELELEKRRANDWRDLMTAAREARAGVIMWNFWRANVFWFGTLILTVGLLIVGFTGQGPERWVTLAAVVAILFSLYFGRAF